MIAFFCATPVQIYQIVNIREKYYKDRKTVLYVLDYFANAEKYVEKIKEQKIFDEVIFVKAWKMHQRIRARKYKDSFFQNFIFSTSVDRSVLKKIYRNFWQLYYYVFNNKVLKLLQLKRDEELAEVFFSYNEPIKVMLALKLKNKFVFSSFEDGSADYVLGVVSEKDRIERLLNVPDYAFSPEKVFAHFPKAMKREEKLRAEIIQVDFSQNKKSREALYEIFDIKNVQEIKEKVIFFDTLVENQNMDSMILPLKIFSTDKIVYKKHPRRRDRYYEDKDLNLYNKDTLPFEMYCEYFDVSDKILISHCSTACISPSLFFNQSPTVVLCYDFATTKNQAEYDYFNDFIKRLIDNDVPLKIHKPKNQKEYQELLGDFYNKLGIEDVRTN